MTAKPKARPKRVYKYRAFSELLVEALVLDSCSSLTCRRSTTRSMPARPSRPTCRFRSLGGFCGPGSNTGSPAK